ncbi:MAG: lysophospholipid acyltransferase family protein [Gammaproteobacteria bacterium]|nr:lysophospholipid acyltransferase family protein [Gammaproteobacteria bacterium]
MPENLKSILAVGLLRFLGKLPLVWLHGISRLLLGLLLVVPNQSFKQTRLNIQRCWPHLTRQQQEKLTRQSLTHTLYATLEMGINWTQPSQRGLESIKSVQGAECLESALKTGGVVLLTPHLGNWELFANWASHQATVTALYKPAKLPGLDQLIHDARSHAGMKLAPATARGVMQLKRALLKGEVNLILPDQEPPPAAGIISQWFNHPAYTMTLASQLANTKNTRIILGYARRLDSSQGFEIELEDITDQCQVVQAGQHDSVVLAAQVQAMNTAVEKLVTSAPEQYQWEYRRFKHTLEQET